MATDTNSSAAPGKEPKVTKLKPGEGASDFQPKQSKARGRSRGTPKGQGRTENPCILKDGTVDPQCKKVYQRSVAGRQTLSQFIQEKAAQGMTEKDIFMAAVNGLMNRRLGYVGAYLDSKNPSRTYNKNQAMKIADAVMSKEGVGDNPGARLTGPSGGGRQRGKKPEPGKHGSSVRQQRKQPGGRGRGFGPPETWPKPGQKNTNPPSESPEQKKTNKPTPAPKTEIQKTLEAVKSGKLSKEDLAKMLQERRERGKGEVAPPLPGSVAAAKRDEGIEARKEAKEEGGRKEKVDKGPSQPVAKREEGARTEPEPTLPSQEEEAGGDSGRLRATDDQITGLFRNVYNQYKQSALAQATYDARKNRQVAPKISDIQLSDEEVADAAQDAIDQLSDQFDIDRDSAIAAINKKYGLNISGGGEQLQPSPTPPISDQSPSSPPDQDDEGGGEEEKGLRPTEDQVTNLFRNVYNQYKQSALAQATYDARKNRQVAPKISDIELSDEEISEAAQDALDRLSEEFSVDREASIEAINKKFGLNIPSGGSTPAGQRGGAPAPAPGVEQPASDQSSPGIEPDPWEGEAPARRIDPGAAPVAPPKSPAALPPARSPRPVTSKGGFRTLAPKSGRGEAKGFTPSRTKIQSDKQAIRQSAQTQSLENFKNSVKDQLNIFGGRGVDTGPTPLEESPDPYQGYRGAPIPKRAGAQAGGREPATAARGQEGQQSLFKKGGIEPRSDLQRKRGRGGTPPAPAPVTERASQVPLRLGGDATQAKMKQQQATAGRREQRLTKEVEKGASASSKQKNFNWVPDPNNPDQGRWVRKAKGRRPKPPNQLGLPFNTGEMMSYDEFSQSVRSLLR